MFPKKCGDKNTVLQRPFSSVRHHSGLKSVEEIAQLLLFLWWPAVILLFMEEDWKPINVTGSFSSKSLLVGYTFLLLIEQDVVVAVHSFTLI